MSFLDMLPGAQEKLEQMQLKLKDVHCRVEVENGAIHAVFDGNGNMVDLGIHEELDQEDLEDLILVLVNKGVEAARLIAEEERNILTKDLLGGLGGL